MSSNEQIAYALIYDNVERNDERGTEWFASWASPESVAEAVKRALDAARDAALEEAASFHDLHARFASENAERASRRGNDLGAVDVYITEARHHESSARGIRAKKGGLR